MKTRIKLIAFLFAITFNANVIGQTEYKVGITGFYNVENLFDTINDPTIEDEEFLPHGDKVWNTKKYQEKLDNMAKVISEIGLDYTPDGVAVLGLSEVENRTVIQDLVKQPPIKDRKYKIVHEQSPDERGIDVALIYNPKYFEYEDHKAIELPLEDDDGEPDYTRDILHVWGKFDGEAMHFLVNHWPSRSGGEAATTHKRQKGAKLCKEVADSLMKADPMAKVIIMGDLNDDPVSASVDEVLNPERKKRKVKEGDLYNPFYNFFKEGIGTGAYRDSWNLFDQVILSYGLVEDKQKGYRLYKAGIFSKDYLLQKTGNFKGYPFRTFGGDRYMGGYSDHFPVYCVFVKPVR
jgi:endonuclease/exonuclease/phosphatase family metal-dependent hydrolase